MTHSAWDDKNAVPYTGNGAHQHERPLSPLGVELPHRLRRRNRSSRARALRKYPADDGSQQQCERTPTRSSEEEHAVSTHAHSGEHSHVCAEVPIDKESCLASFICTDRDGWPARHTNSDTPTKTAGMPRALAFRLAGCAILRT